MLAIENISKLNKRWRLLFILSLALTAAIALFFYTQYIQTQQRAISSEKLVSSLRMQTLKAQTDGDLNNAEKLCASALAEAENCGSSMKVIEFLSRLVQIKIQNHHLGQTDALVQKAIKLALSIKDTKASDSNLEVWMDDMANTYYKRGECSTRDDIKEYCLKHYLDIKLPLEDHFDPILTSRGHMMVTYFKFHGRYLDELPYEKKVFDYIQRVKFNDAPIMAGAYINLGLGYLLAQQPSDAECAFKKAFGPYNNKPASINEAELNSLLSHVREVEGNLQAARVCYQNTLKLEKKFSGESAISTGTNEAILGYLEQRLGNLAEAARLYAASLDCLDKCAIPKSSSANAFIYPAGQLYSGQVFASEHLAQIALQKGDSALAHSLQAQAKRIRLQNPQWAACNHPDPNAFFAIAGTFPFYTDIIPTRIKLEEIIPQN